MKQMIQWIKSGEVQVIDAEAGVASEFLHHSERALPLEDYCLDFDFGQEDRNDYVVIREESL